MQGTRPLLLAIAGLTSLFISIPAFAVMSAPYGWYLEANGGSTNMSNTSYPGNVSTSGFGGNADLGYKFMPYFGIEIGYTRYANTIIKEPNNSATAANVENFSYDLAAKAILPIATSGFEAFAKGGVGRTNADVSVSDTASANALGLSDSNHSATGAYIALGGQWYFMQELAFVAQWARATGDSTTGTMDLYSLGLSFIID
ncbi:MAG: porin family protein [Gammaproteobacteria bacterium]|nr:MAG: porin family protein [Gammaproteobacteria bacterium]